MEFVFTDLKCISYYQYLGSNKRYITKRGKAYKQSYLDQLNKQMIDKGYEIFNSKSIEVDMVFYFDNRRCNDIENAMKVPLDLLEKIAYTNDRWITKISCEKHYLKDPPFNLKIIIKDREIEEI